MRQRQRKSLKKDLFELHLNALEAERTRFSNCESKINASWNSINFSVALWVISTTLSVESDSSVCFFAIYGVGSLLFIILACLSCYHSYSAIKFTNQFDLPYGEDFSRAFLERNSEFYSFYTQKILDAVSNYIQSNSAKVKKIKAANKFGVYAFAVSFLLAFICVTHKIMKFNDSKSSEAIVGHVLQNHSCINESRAPDNNLGSPIVNINIEKGGELNECSKHRTTAATATATTCVSGNRSRIDSCCISRNAVSARKL